MIDQALIQARAAEVAGVCPRTWRRWEQAGRVPAPDGTLPSGKPFWWLSTIKRAFSAPHQAAA